ncbi:MAG: helix-turn-helix transcriptional regulator [Syntrophomonadaceae bacterium]|jgi:DNA-binding Xre family transcriptional regulator|nr:helix-turn-helix transcriptional regulator [Syntrophomonadaceae bacterium]
MHLSMGEKVKIVLIKRKMTNNALAEKLGMTPQNLSNKLKRDNLAEREIREIAEALNCDFEGVFTLRDTGEKV